MGLYEARCYDVCLVLIFGLDVFYAFGSSGFVLLLKNFEDE